MADGLDMSEMMKRAVQANAKFYKGWVDLTLEYVRGMSAILGGEPESTASHPEMDAGTGALVMEGEAGDVARGAFLVTNDLGRTLSCEFIASAFNDALGARVDVKANFDPARIELQAGEQRVIQVAMTIDPALQPGVGFAGEFSIAGMDGFAVPVVLRRLHRADETTNGKESDSSPRVGKAAESAASANASVRAKAKRAATTGPAKKSKR